MIAESLSLSLEQGWNWHSVAHGHRPVCQKGSPLAGTSDDDDEDDEDPRLSLVHPGYPMMQCDK